MDDGLKQRVVGAVVLVAAAVIVLPSIFDGPVQGPGLAPVTLPGRPEMPPVEPLNQFNDNKRAALQEGIVQDRLKLAVDSEVVVAPNAGEPSKPVKHLSAAWVVQLGSFRDAKNAQDLVDNLRVQGYHAYAEPVAGDSPDEGKALTRVFVGPELKKDKAQFILAQLEEQLSLKGMLVRFVP